MTVFSASAIAAPKIHIVATVGMVADIVRALAGEQADVTTLIGEGVDPHVYKPTRNDVLLLSRADMIFYNGLLLEGKMAETLARLGRQGKPVHAVAALLAEDALLAAEGNPQHHDPHIWMDARLWARAVDQVASALIEHYPAWAESVPVKAAAYKASLEHLHRYVAEIMGTVPEERRVLITAHDAFHYFGRAYGVEVLGIQGLSTESEAGLNDINRLVDTLVQRDIRAIFVETSVADRNVRALIEGAKARGHSVVVGGTLFSDAMGAPGTYEGTYIGMMDHNASTIARALGGTVPEGGFRAWNL
jgi:manganese/zinc/iron transport system substrate-binding protein